MPKLMREFLLLLWYMAERSSDVDGGSRQRIPWFFSSAGSCHGLTRPCLEKRRLHLQAETGRDQQRQGTRGRLHPGPGKGGNVEQCKTDRARDLGELYTLSEQFKFYCIKVLKIESIVLSLSATT